MSRSNPVDKEKEIKLDNLIRKLERLLDVEIENLPDTLNLVCPDKRVDFVAKVLPVITKYRESHSTFMDWDV